MTLSLNNNYINLDDAQLINLNKLLDQGESCCIVNSENNTVYIRIDSKLSLELVDSWRCTIFSNNEVAKECIATFEDFFKIGHYNIVKCIHISDFIKPKEKVTSKQRFRLINTIRNGTPILQSSTFDLNKPWEIVPIDFVTQKEYNQAIADLDLETKYRIWKDNPENKPISQQQTKSDNGTDWTYQQHSSKPNIFTNNSQAPNDKGPEVCKVIEDAVKVIRDGLITKTRLFKRTDEYLSGWADIYGNQLPQSNQMENGRLHLQNSFSSTPNNPQVIDTQYLSPQLNQIKNLYRSLSNNDKSIFTAAMNGAVRFSDSPHGSTQQEQDMDNIMRATQHSMQDGWNTLKSRVESATDAEKAAYMNDRLGDESMSEWFLRASTNYPYNRDKLPASLKQFSPNGSLIVGVNYFQIDEDNFSELDAIIKRDGTWVVAVESATPAGSRLIRYNDENFTFTNVAISEPTVFTNKFIAAEVAIYLNNYIIEKKHTAMKFSEYILYRHKVK